MFVYMTIEPVIVNGVYIGWLKTNVVLSLFLTWKFCLEVLFWCVVMVKDCFITYLAISELLFMC